jgi:transcriptional regulator with XRE-family HTH domain
MEEIRSELKSARLERGLSLDAVSKIVGIPAKTMSDIETGYVLNPTFSNIITLINFYKLDLKSLCEKYDLHWEINFIRKSLDGMNIGQVRKVKRFIQTEILNQKGKDTK